MGNDVKEIGARWGTECQRLRRLAAKTQQELADTLHVSAVTVSSWETGRRIPNQDITEQVDTALSTGGTLTRLRNELVSRKDVPEWFRDEITMERRAHEIKHYQPLVIPGLLQTDAYAQTLIAARLGRSNSEQVQKLVTTRTERFGALTKTDPLLWFVIRQAVFEQPVGNDTVMRHQLSEIVRLAEEERIRVQVLPNIRAAIGLCDAFRVMSLNETQSVTFVEHTMGSTLFDAPERVNELLRLFGFISAEALSQADSIDLIRKTNEEKYGHVD
ncbi:helix-turn-helix domain-containing protein [Halostreptopolyspora alba]|uniref:XRE family transcriptional regulator n=1 Tax=Halostreptopolyspora alba TaxID=2487137 RepID=A0A3N0E4N7_9ACTN|nr:XRE family transcriptional regulator [Nocardiopsaceae bacterium YIM 96095]